MAEKRTSKKIGAILLGISVFVLLCAIVFALYVDNQNRKYQDRVRDAVYSAGVVRDAIMHYYEDNKALPADRAALLKRRGQDKDPYLVLWPQLPGYTFDIKDGVLTVSFNPGKDPLAGKSVTFRPLPTKLVLEWDCRTTVEEGHRPAFCKPQ
jgi:hypothetical protein